MLPHLAKCWLRDHVAALVTAIAGDEEEEQADADAGEKCGHGKH